MEISNRKYYKSQTIKNVLLNFIQFIVYVYYYNNIQSDSPRNITPFICFDITF